MEKYRGIPNLHFAGHVDGAEKEKFLRESKILANTSIHEALPVSFLEALAYGTVLVSNRNPEDLTSKFGIWVGDVLGDGFDKVGLYVDAIRKLMTDDELRRAMADAAIDYVRRIHNVPRFVRDLRNVIYEEAKK
jgi:glycosyltransferase involved in cell wall biosynthesis